MTQCAVEKTVNMTCTELVQFRNIITKIRLNEFQCYLPPSIRKIIKDPSKKRESEDASTSNPKTTPKRPKQEATMICNEDMVSEWKLRDNEK